MMLMNRKETGEPGLPPPPGALFKRRLAGTGMGGTPAGLGTAAPARYRFSFA